MTMQRPEVNWRNPNLARNALITILGIALIAGAFWVATKPKDAFIPIATPSPTMDRDSQNSVGEGIYQEDIFGFPFLCGMLNSREGTFDDSKPEFANSWEIWEAIKQSLENEPEQFVVLKGDEPPEVRELHGDSRNREDASGSRACFLNYN